MKQPARNRETGQRLTRDDLAPGAGIGRTAEIGALATAASAMALGTLNAMERQATLVDHPSAATQPRADGAVSKSDAQTDGVETLARHGMPALSSDQIQLPNGAPPSGQAASTNLVMDPSALTARIAEQIASSVSHVLDTAAGNRATADTLARDIVGQSLEIAHDIHDQIVAREPLAVLADLVPGAAGITAGIDGLAEGIIRSVDALLSDGGVVDLLTGAAPIVDADKILGDIVAELHGLKLPIDVASLASGPIDAVEAIPESLLGGEDHGRNPLADLFYDDGGADIAKSVIGDAAGIVSDFVSQTLKIGFLAQPLDLGEELGGLMQGSNALHLV